MAFLTSFAVPRVRDVDEVARPKYRGTTGFLVIERGAGAIEPTDSLTGRTTLLRRSPLTRTRASGFDD